MSEDPTAVSTDRVIEILQREPLGAALLKAAIAEATVEIYRDRIAELERQKAPAAVPPAHLAKE